MADVGTGIERSTRGDLRRVSSDASNVDIVDVEVVSTESADLVRESHARHTEVAGRVLSLLSSLGNLALRILEQRVDVRSAPLKVPGANDKTGLAGPQMRGTSTQQGSGFGRGQGGQRRRRRHRGAS